MVSVRGGAPFLSGVDGALLVEWLDDELSSTIICAAIDKVALRRRKKRVTTRLTLRSCRGELKKLQKKKKSIESLGQCSYPKFRKIKIFLGSHAFPKELDEHRKILLSQFNKAEHNLANVNTAQALELVAKQTIKAIRFFHDALWEFSSDQHEQLQQSAEVELSSLRNLLGPSQWRDAVEEVMRDALRSKYPLLTAESVWNALNTPRID